MVGLEQAVTQRAAACGPGTQPQGGLTPSDGPRWISSGSSTFEPFLGGAHRCEMRTFVTNMDHVDLTAECDQIRISGKRRSTPTCDTNLRGRTLFINLDLLKSRPTFVVRPLRRPSGPSPLQKCSPTYGVRPLRRPSRPSSLHRMGTVSPTHPRPPARWSVRGCRGKGLVFNVKKEKALHRMGTVSPTHPHPCPLVRPRRRGMGFVFNVKKGKTLEARTGHGRSQLRYNI